MSKILPTAPIVNPIINETVERLVDVIGPGWKPSYLEHTKTGMSAFVLENGEILDGLLDSMASQSYAAGLRKGYKYGVFVGAVALAAGLATGYVLDMHGDKIAAVCREKWDILKGKMYVERD